MDKEILNSYTRLNGLNVSRETFLDFEDYISLILEKNEKINIISRKTASKKSIIERHIIDSAQIIDFVDLNSNTTTDLGSGGGMPGIPPPVPKSLVVLLFKSIKSIICAESIICLTLIPFFSKFFLLTKLISSFLSWIIEIKLSNSTQVSRETFSLEI